MSESTPPGSTRHGPEAKLGNPSQSLSLWLAYTAQSYH